MMFSLIKHFCDTLKDDLVDNFSLDDYLMVALAPIAGETNSVVLKVKLTNYTETHYEDGLEHETEKRKIFWQNFSVELYLEGINKELMNLGSKYSQKVNRKFRLPFSYTLPDEKQYSITLEQSESGDIYINDQYDNAVDEKDQEILPYYYSEMWNGQLTYTGKDTDLADIKT